MEDNIQPNLEPTSPIDLPDDLQIPVESTHIMPTPVIPSTPPTFTETPIATSLTSSSQNEPAFKSAMPRRQTTSLLKWVGIGLAVILLVGTTIYFVLSQIGFNRGKLQLTFEPTGVDLTIDQTLQKKSVNSLTVSLKAGDHNILVTKDGYLDYEQTFSIQPKETAEMDIILDPIPNMELVAETSVIFPTLISRDTLLAFFDKTVGEFKAVNLSDKTVVSLFGLHLPNLQSINWSPSGVAGIIKLPNVWKLANMKDNRKAQGQYIPLGGAPEQGPTFNNGISTWLIDSDRHTNSGLQPILLNENVRSTVFSADGSQIVYFYETADGEKSLIRAEDIDGSSWVRLTSSVDAINPILKWINDDRHILLIDDAGKPDKLFDILNKEFTDVMLDRIANTLVASSPDGNRIAYIANSANGPRLAIWNIQEQKTEKVFDQQITTFVWQVEDTIITATPDGNLWYWGLAGQVKPIKFMSAFGALQPEQLLYSRLLQKLFIFSTSQVFSVKV